MNTRAQAAIHTLWSDFDARPLESWTQLKRRLLFCGVLLATLLILASVVPIGSAVVGAGQVAVESRVKRVAHPTGGVIAEILVSNGDYVKKGQPLLRLEDTVTDAQQLYTGISVEQLLAQEARLVAEKSGAATVRFSEELTRGSSASARAAITGELALFALHRQQDAQRQAQIRARIQQYREGIAGYDAQIDANLRQLELIQPELEGLRTLWERRLVTINRLNELERTAISLEGSIGSLRADIARARALIVEAEEQLIQIAQSRLTDAAAELSQLRNALNGQKIQKVTAGQEQAERVLRAPHEGVVEKLAFASVGEVVRAAEPILEIVPRGERMIVETQISLIDIDRVTEGQSAHIRFSAFNRATTPEISGRVTYVATDYASNERSNFQYYLVTINLSQDELKKVDIPLRSGMPAEVFIDTGNRTMISYIMKPFVDQISRAFKAE